MFASPKVPQTGAPNNNFCFEFATAYNQLSKHAEESCNQAYVFYRNHKAAIDNNLPLILKVSFFAIAFYSTFLYTCGATAAGYALKDRVDKVTWMCKDAWDYLMASRRYTEEEKTVLKITILAVGLISVYCMPWQFWTIPVGLTFGSHLYRFSGMITSSCRT